MLPPLPTQIIYATGIPNFGGLTLSYAASVFSRRFLNAFGEVASQCDTALACTERLGSLRIGQLLRVATEPDFILGRWRAQIREELHRSEIHTEADETPTDNTTQTTGTFTTISVAIGETANTNSAKPTAYARYQLNYFCQVFPDVLKGSLSTLDVD